MDVPVTPQAPTRSLTPEPPTTPDSSPFPPPTNLDQGVVALTHAIRNIETGNKDIKGESGELASRYQFMPETWKAWAGKYLGDPNAPLTPANQNFVAYNHIKSLRDQGYNPDQILSIWNHGSPKYEGQVGVNKEGVKFDVPAYVQRGMAEFQKEAEAIKQAGGVPVANAATADPSQPDSTDPLGGKSFEELYGQAASDQSAPEQGLGERALSFAGNVGGSLLSGLGNAVAHPIDTAEGIAKDAAMPFARAGASLVKADQGLFHLGTAVFRKLTGDHEGYATELQKALKASDPRNSTHVPLLGDVPTFGQYGDTRRDLADVGGAGVNAAGTLLGGGEIGAAAKLGIGGRILKTAGEGAIGGALVGGGQGLSSGLGDPNASAGNVAARALTGTLIGGVAGGVAGGALGTTSAALKSVKDFVSPSVEAALTKGLRPGKAAETFGKTLEDALPYVREAEGASGKPINTVAALDDAVKNAKQSVWKKYEQVLGPNANATIDGNAIADKIESSIDPRFDRQDPSAAARIRAYAKTYRRDIPLSEAEDALQSVNADLHTYYAKNKVGQQVAASDPSQAYVLNEGNALRDALNEKLGQLSGKDAAQLKKAYGSLSKLQEMTSKQRGIVANAAPVGLGEQIGMARGLGKIITGHPLEGAADVFGSQYLRDKNNPDTLVKGAFDKLRKKSFDPASTAIRSVSSDYPIAKNLKTLALPAPQAGSPNASVHVPINMPARSLSSIQAGEDAAGSTLARSLSR